MVINIVFTLIILSLAIWDLRSFGGNNHKDFKSLIISLGILGTFVGIFIGLMGFNTHDLLSSVPMLLDGLKTAFYTSIVGMGSAISLSIYQKGKSKAAENSEVDFIATQARKLDELLHLRELSNVTSVLQNIKGELNKREDFEKDLKQMLKDIDISLHKALETLASGASKELIKALEIVISDFNNNLKEQFGENFKQLNEATHNMLTWQNEYKDQIINNTNAMQAMRETLKDAQDSMNKATESIIANKENLMQIQQYNEQNSSIQEKLLQALQTLNTLSHSFEDKLQAVASLKDSSLAALQDSKSFIHSLQEAKDTLREYLKHYEEKLLEFFNQSCTRLNDTNSTLQSQNDSILQSISSTHKEFSNSLQNANMEVLESFKVASQTSNNLAQIVNDDMQAKSNALLALNENFKQNADSMLEKLDETSNKSLSHAQQMQEQMQNLYNEKFAILNEKITDTTKTLRETLTDNANNLENFTKDSIQTISNAFEERDRALQNTMQNNYEHVMNRIDTLHRDFQDKVSKDYQYMQDKILETSQASHEFLQDCAKEFADSSKTSLNTSIEATSTLAKEHAKTLQDMQEQNINQVETHINKAKEFLLQTQEASLQALENLHTKTLERLETTSNATTKHTIDNLTQLHNTHNEQMEKSMQTTHNHLEREISMLHDTTKDTLQNMQDGLQTQHTKTTDSIASVIKASSQHFIQTSDDFVELLKGQYKRMNTTFDKQGQEIKEFLQTQTQTLQESLLAQHENLKNTLDSQTSQLQQDLTQKGTALHEFLQTQTTCLDTNLQQMLGKFNKMLEHNYMNLSDMLEKDNNLIVKSLDSQAINLSNSLIQSQKKLDDFLHITYDKLTNNADSMLDKITGNATTLSRNLTLTGDALKESLQSVVDNLQKTNNASKEAYDKHLEHTLSTQQTIVADIQTKSQTFYDLLGKNLQDFTQNFQTTSRDIQDSCKSIVNDINVVRESSQTLSMEAINQAKDSYMKFHENLQTNLTNITQGIAEQFSGVMQKNELLLQSFEDKIANLGNTFSDFDSNTKANFENLNTHFKTLCVQYVKLMQASMQANIKNQSQITEQLHKVVSDIESQVRDIATSSNTLLTNQKETLESVVSHFKANTEEIVRQGAILHDNLGTNLEALDSKMEQMTQSFARNYEWFLKKVKEIMGVA